MPRKAAATTTAKNTAAKKVVIRKEKTYRLADNKSGETFSIKIGRKGNLTIFDEEQGVRRAIRHCPNQSSIYLDDQDQYARVEPVIFRKGFLTVKETDPLTQEFLDKHPSNKANGGVWFEYINDEEIAKENIEIEELKIDLKYLIRKVSKETDGIHKLKAEVAVLKGDVDSAMSKGVEELKEILYDEVSFDPYRFADEEGNPTIFDNEEVTTKYLVLQALRAGIIIKSPTSKSILWSKNREVIATAPLGLDLLDYFASFLLTDEGILVAQEIKNRR